MESGQGGAGLTNVRQAVELLMHLGKSRTPQHVRALAEHIGTSKSTVQRILATLEAAQMVRLDPESQAYRLGPAIVALHADFTASQDSMQDIKDLMEGLRQHTGETAMLSVIYGTERLVILRVESHQSLRYVRPVGGNYPLHIGATSKALLSCLTDDELTTLLPRLPMHPNGPNAITSRKQLRQEVKATRKTGYAVSREESVTGVAGVAVPVRVKGLGITALGVFGPVQRFTDSDVSHHVPLLLAAAREIESIE